MEEEAYPAQSANLGYNFRNYEKGMVFTVSGYNQKLHLLVELIIKYIVNINDKITKEMFEAVKDKLLKHYYNSILKPGGLARDIRLNVLIENHSSNLSKYNATPSLTIEDLKSFSETFISNLFVKSLVQGNVTKEHAVEVVKSVISHLHCKPSEVDRSFRVIEIPKGESFCVVESLNKNDANSIITNYYQTGPYTLHESVILEIFSLIIEEPLFDTLRTKEQLGYSVECTERDTFGILGFTITVNAQATKNATHYVNDRIEEFLKQVSELLSTMTSEEFDVIKSDLIKTKKCADTHLKQEVSRNWSEIIDEDYMFDEIKREIGEIEKINLEDLRVWWDANALSGNKSNFRKLSIQVSGFKNTEEKVKEEAIQENAVLELKFLDTEEPNVRPQDNNARFIREIGAFKKGSSLYPVVSKLSTIT